MLQTQTKIKDIFSSLRGKLLFWFLLVSLTPMLVLGVVAFISAQRALQDEFSKKLEAVEIIKTNQIEAWLSDRKNDALFARDLVVVRGTEGVNEGLPTLVKFKNDPTNPAYVEAVKRADGVLSSFTTNIGDGVYADIMLVDSEGDVVFAIDPRSRGTNLLETGEVNPLVFQGGLQALTVGDIQKNPVHKGDFHIRIAVPVLDDNDQTVGVLILEADAQVLKDIMNERTGLGDSGETYLVGQDKLFRNDSRFLDQLGVETTILNHDVVVDTVASQAGLAGGSDIQVIDDYRGVPVLSSWGFVTVQEPTDINPTGVRWALMAEIDQAEVNQPIISMAKVIGYLSVFMLGLVVVVVILVSSTLSNPIKHIAEVARDVAGGNLTRQLDINTGDEIEQLATAFNEMTTEISKTLNTVEQRTQQLEIITVLSERLSAILNLEDLLAGTVRQIQENFGYYHAHIYLLDPKQENLVVAAGTGEAGVEMKEKGHSIPVDAPISLVARAARTGEIIKADNVHETPDWLPNPLLPNTYSEIAVSIMLEGQVVGVLDVQEDEVAGLDEGDIGLLRSLANQVAIAIRNARLFEEVETALAEAQALQEQYVTQSWDRKKITRQNMGQVRFSLGESTTLTEVAVTEARHQALTQTEPAVVGLNGSQEQSENTLAADQNALVAPITLREVTIGNLQLHNIDPNRKWTDGEMAYIKAVIDQVAQAAENLRLLNETQERASREQLIGQISNKLRNAPDLESLMQIGVGELSKVLDPSRTFIQFGTTTDFVDQKLAAIEQPQTEENTTDPIDIVELVKDGQGDTQDG